MVVFCTSPADQMRVIEEDLLISLRAWDFRLVIFWAFLARRKFPSDMFDAFTNTIAAM